jgi:hypothetical protein
MLPYGQHDNDIPCFPKNCNVMLNEVKHLMVIALKDNERILSIIGGGLKSSRAFVASEGHGKTTAREVTPNY